eukprot:gb/GECG01003604.1/.p1 GENE.gb/GECG01003604.1/~~gb/GECG01003604.1/.p1  ORF type:complete len:166 (+),score=3.76 gb/GECG01003604.1/:1-498(+)
MPIVVTKVLQNESSMYLVSRLVFPTPLSPSKSTLNCLSKLLFPPAEVAEAPDPVSLALLAIFYSTPFLASIFSFCIPLSMHLVKSDENCANKSVLNSLLFVSGQQTQLRCEGRHRLAHKLPPFTFGTVTREVQVQDFSHGNMSVHDILQENWAIQTTNLGTHIGK